MSAETRKVLEMMAEGKITSEDAERLLDKLAGTRPSSEGENGATNAPSPSVSKQRPAVLRFLRVVINADDAEKHDVNVKVPLSFLRSGVKLLGMLPPRVARKLNDKGVNLDFLSELRPEDLDEALNALHVEVDTDEGQHVRVFCE